MGVNESVQITMTMAAPNVTILKIRLNFLILIVRYSISDFSSFFGQIYYYLLQFLQFLQWRVVGRGGANKSVQVTITIV